MQITRVEATPRSGEGLRDVRGDVVRRRLQADHSIQLTEVRSIVGFLINSDITAEQISQRADDLFADPIIEHSLTNQTFLRSKEIFDQVPDAVISVGFKPGVTDNPGKAALDGFRTFFLMQVLNQTSLPTSPMLFMGFQTKQLRNLLHPISTTA